MVEMLTEYLSPQMIPIVITVAIIVLAFVLVTVMRRVVAFLLGRIAPGWVDNVTILLQVAVVVGEFALIGSFFVPDEWITWLAAGAVLLFVLISGLLLAANPIRDGIATLRIRGFRRYRVGDWVTVTNNVHGLVVAIRPLSTQVRTPKQELLTVQNRLVVGAPIQVYRTEQEISTLTAIAQNYLSAGSTNAHLLAVKSDGLENHQAAPSTDAAADKMQDAGLLQFGHSTITLPAALLSKRPVLGKKSIKSLIRS